MMGGRVEIDFFKAAHTKLQVHPLMQVVSSDTSGGRDKCTSQRVEEENNV